MALAVTRESVAVPQSEERASPRNPSVETDVKSEKLVNFDVWCLSAVREDEYDAVIEWTRAYRSQASHFLRSLSHCPSLRKIRRRDRERRVLAAREVSLIAEDRRATHQQTLRPRPEHSRAIP